MEDLQVQMKSLELMSTNNIQESVCSIESKKINDDKIGGICEKNFFSTCSIRYFFRLIHQYSITKETSKDIASINKNFKKRRFFSKCPEKKLEEIRKKKQDELKQHRRQKRDHERTSFRDIDSDVLSRQMIEMDLESDREMDENIKFFRKKYRFFFSTKASFLFALIINFFLEHKDINTDELCVYYSNLDEIEKKLNAWVVEKKDEIEDRIKIKIYCMLSMIYQVLSVSGMIDFHQERDVIECGKLKMTRYTYSTITSLPDLSFLNIKELQIMGVSIRNIFYNKMTLINLVYLTLNHCKIQNIPNDIFIDCHHLKFLSLSGNFLKGLPVFHENTERMDFSYNELDDIGIKSILNSLSIKILNLSHNKLKKIPILPEVNTLHLNNNNIQNDEEDDQLKFLPKLFYIDMSCNELTRVPSFVPDELCILNIAYNKISSISKLTIYQGNSLSSVNISGNFSLSNEDIILLSSYLNEGCCIVHDDTKHYQVGYDDFNLHFAVKNTKEVVEDEMIVD